MGHSWNLSCPKGQGREITSSRPAWATLWDLVSKYKGPADVVQKYSTCLKCVRSQVQCQVPSRQRWWFVFVLTNGLVFVGFLLTFCFKVVFTWLPWRQNSLKVLSFTYTSTNCSLSSVFRSFVLKQFSVCLILVILWFEPGNILPFSPQSVYQPSQDLSSVSCQKSEIFFFFLSQHLCAVLEFVL